MNPAVHVSCIVPMYNAQDTIVETLQSLLDLQGSGRLEIILVDDGSTDLSVKMVEEWIRQTEPFPKTHAFRLLRLHHGGEAAAINAGIKNSKPDFTAWVESDVKLAPNWLELLLPLMQDDSIAGAGGVLHPAENDSPLAKIFGYEITYKIMSNVDFPKHITSANALYRSDIFPQIGLCSEQLGESSFDSDFNQRILQAGYKLRLHPQAYAWHHFKTRLRDCLLRTWWYGYRRPWVKAQVLYPFDRWIGVLVLLSASCIPAMALVLFMPLVAGGLLFSAFSLHGVYSLFLYYQFKETVLLFSTPVFWVRNLLFFIAYGCGWIVKFLTSIRVRP